VTPKTKLGETLRPTPYTPQTYWELPKNDPNAYFFYFTSDEYREDDSKYRKLDETLLHYGAYSSTKEVITTEKNRIPEPLWDSILNELDIEDWPALAVCRTSLGFEDISLADKTFACPHDVEIATLEQGIISDNLLRDKDRIKDFLNELYSGAKEDNLKQTMEDEKISELLNIGGRKLEELIQINPSM
jgi:hypothetical protein